MGDAVKCGQKAALKNLYDGKLLFTKMETIEHQKRKGCMECDETRAKGNYCYVCGEELSNDFLVPVRTGFKEYRLKWMNFSEDEDGTLRVESRTREDDLFSHDPEEVFTLEMFMNQKEWSWIW